MQHYKGIIESNSGGSGLGYNTFRWTERDPTTGAGIIDVEAPLKRMGVLLTDNRFDLINALLRMGREYSRFMRRFNNRLTQLWQSGGFNDTSTTATVLNQVINEIVLQGDPSKPFNSGVMGTFTRTTTNTSENIPIPTSVARFGSSQVYLPRLVSYPEGNYVLGHDGSLYPAYGDKRDEILIALETIYYNKIPSHRQLYTH